MSAVLNMMLKMQSERGYEMDDFESGLVDEDELEEFLKGYWCDLNGKQHCYRKD